MSQMEQVFGTTSKIKQKDKENVKIEKKKNFFDRLAYIKNKAQKWRWSWQR